MVREVLFRGKTEKNDNWVYGSLNNTDHQFPEIMYCDKNWSVCSTSIKPETIGQYTGLKDKNGTKIFEGDIVGCFCNTQIFQVKWCDVRGGYFLDDVVMCGGSEPAPECLGNLVDTIEVIGNIYDNPELLEDL